MPDPNDPISTKKEIYFLISGPLTILSRDSSEFIKIFSNVDEFLKENNSL